MAEFEKAQYIVGLNEGGYQIDPRDSGNYYNGELIGTNWGISAPTLATFLGRTPTREEMQGLSRKTAEQILKNRYWLKNHLHLLKNQSVATLIYDGVVNHGTNGMRFLVNKAIKRIGGSFNYYSLFTEKGIKYLNNLNPKKLFYAIKKARADKYRSSSQIHYIKGWLNRLERIKYYAYNTISAVWPYVAGILSVFGVLLIVI